MRTLSFMTLAVIAGGLAIAAPSTDPDGLSARIENIIQKADKDADGRITKAEAGEAAWFARLDQDGDGVISAEELNQMRRIVEQRGGAAGGRRLPTNAPSIKPEDLRKITSGPEVLKPGEVGIGRMIPDVAFTDLAGKSHRLSDSRKGTVIIMTSATCPVSKRYASSIAELDKQIASQGLSLLLVNPLASEKPEEIRPSSPPPGSPPPMSTTRKRPSPAPSRPAPRRRSSSWMPPARSSTVAPSTINTASTTI